MHLRGGGAPRWSNDETETLCTHWRPGVTMDVLKFLLPSRSHRAIATKANWLGLKSRFRGPYCTNFKEVQACRDLATITSPPTAQPEVVAAPSAIKFRRSRHAGTFLDKHELTRRRRPVLGACVTAQYFDDPSPERRQMIAADSALHERPGRDYGPDPI